MPFETLLQKYNSRAATIYNQTITQPSANAEDLIVVPYRTSVINTSQPYVFIKPNTTTASSGVPKGRFGYAFTSLQSRIKDDRREFPVVSSIRDSSRLIQFAKSPMGTRFITQQFALQAFNAYPKTRIWNPASVFASALGPYIVGTNLTQRPFDAKGVFRAIRGLNVLLPKNKKVIESSAQPRTEQGTQGTTTPIVPSRIQPDTFLGTFERGIYIDNGYFDKAGDGGNFRAKAKQLLKEFVSSVTPFGPNSADRYKKSNIQDPYNRRPIAALGLEALDSIEYDFLKATRSEIPGTDIITFAFGNTGTLEEQNEVVPFRAFISEIKENVKPEFNEQRYIGRTERFVTYAGAKRGVTINFKVAALSRAERLHTWTRINYLTGLAFPKDVSGTGFMVPPLFRITLGNIYVSQPCYIESLDYTFLDEDITFDIDSPFQVSQVIKVNMTLQLIENRSKYANSKFYEIVDRVSSLQRETKPTPPEPAEPDVPVGI